jgi:hypothetical protein
MEFPFSAGMRLDAYYPKFWSCSSAPTLTVVEPCRTTIVRERASMFWAGIKFGVGLWIGMSGAVAATLFGAALFERAMAWLRGKREGGTANLPSHGTSDSIRALGLPVETALTDKHSCKVLVLRAVIDGNQVGGRK